MSGSIKLFIERHRVLVWVVILAFFMSASFSFIYACRYFHGEGQEKHMTLDIDGRAESFVLENGQLRIYREGKILWESQEEHYIDNFYIGDVDNDGSKDLLLSVWKEGSFGEHRPFWHEGADDDYKNHLFIYKLGKERVKALWCSSNLDRPIVSIEITDVDKDGQNEMIVTAGRYEKGPRGKFALNKKAPTETKVWQWMEWGFTPKLIEEM